MPFDIDGTRLMRHVDNHYWRNLIAEWLRHRHHHLRHHKHHHVHVVLFVNGVGVILNPGQLEKIMITETLGHSIHFVITVLDQSGNPMLTQPAFDSPPVWAQTTAATESLIVAADGASADAASLAVGTDSISATAIVGGKTFTASVAVEVDAVPQVASSISIDGTVSA